MTVAEWGMGFPGRQRKQGGGGLRREESRSRNGILGVCRRRGYRIR